MAVAAHYGASVAWHCEFDKHPSKILANHFPDVPNYGDVSAVEWSQVEPVDILTGGFPCFPAGTLITTDTGQVPIEDVRVGDSVLTHRRRMRPVVQTMTRVADHRVHVKVMGAPVVVTTDEHPFYARRTRDSDPEWIAAGSLTVDMQVARIDSDGEMVWVPVRNTVRDPQTQTVFNIGVDTDESYIADGFVVHNCQDVSTAGMRRGIRPGTRSGLWEHFAYAIDQLKPEIVVIENVAGLLSADAVCDVEPCPWCVGDDPRGHMRALGAVLSDLAEVGFDARWGSFLASDVGAPHRRERIFIVARPQRSSAWTVAEYSGGFREGGGSASSVSSAVDGSDGSGGVRRATETSSGRDDGAGDADGDRPGDVGVPVGRLLPTPTASAAKHGSTPDVHAQGFGSNLWDIPHVMELLPTPVVNDMGRGKTLEWWDEWNDRVSHGKSLDVEAVKLASGGHTAVELAAGYGDFGIYAPALKRWGQILGRDVPPMTVTDAKGGTRLSPVFVEFMMGLPQGWVTDAGLSHNMQLKALGNGVCPQQSKLALSVLDPVLEA